MIFLADNELFFRCTHGRNKRCMGPCPRLPWFRTEQSRQQTGTCNTVLVLFKNSPSVLVRSVLKIDAKTYNSFFNHLLRGCQLCQRSLFHLQVVTGFGELEAQLSNLFQAL